MAKGKLIVISGPTASGKSELAFQLAQHWNCPILSADSRQIYKEVDIGTGKPPKFMLNATKHYFIDHVDVDKTYSVGEFESEALACLHQLFAIHERVVVCGGTGLYIKALLNGLDDLPQTDEITRSKVRAILETEGLEALLEWLHKIDPEYYEVVDRRNSRRVSRALEIFLMTGQTFSSFRKNHPQLRFFDTREFCLMPDRETLYRRIEARVDIMMEEGLLEEARRLKAYKNDQALNTVGYKELFEFMEGKMTLDEAVRLIKQHTRNYAKRQITWFRKESPEKFLIPDQNQMLRNILEIV